MAVLSRSKFQMLPEAPKDAAERHFSTPTLRQSGDWGRGEGI
jgi:hypothetical protein